MHATALFAANSRSTFLSALLTTLFLVPAAFFIYLVLHGPGLEQEIFSPDAAASVRAIVLQARTALEEAVKALPLPGKQCELGMVCIPGANRPLLADGRTSRAVWDLPRRLMKENFRDVEKILPNAKVNYIWEEPLVVYFDNVLADEEIDLITKTVQTRFKQSMVVDENGKPRKGTSRTSDTAWIFINEDPRFRAIVNKVAALSGFTELHAEHLGVNRYRSSQFFNPHFDYLNEDQLHHGEFKGCQRASTVLIYLTDVEDGGETMFARKRNMDGRFAYDASNPDHLRITPKRGRVLVWYNMHPYTEKTDDRTLHGGAPVRQGEKMAATIFIRNCTRTLPQTSQVPTTDRKDDVSQTQRADISARDAAHENEHARQGPHSPQTEQVTQNGEVVPNSEAIRAESERTGVHREQKNAEKPNIESPSQTSEDEEVPRSEDVDDTMDSPQRTDTLQQESIPEPKGIGATENAPLTEDTNQADEVQSTENGSHESNNIAQTGDAIGLETNAQLNNSPASDPDSAPEETPLGQEDNTENEVDILPKEDL